MDGVLVDSEHVWDEVEREYLPTFFGPQISSRMGSLVGIGVNDVVVRARSLGAVFDDTDYFRLADEMAKLVYARAPLTKGVDALAERLISFGYKLGVVTQSPQQWVDQVIPKFPFKDNLGIILSLHEHPELKRKPYPDGFLYAIQYLGATPTSSRILEDSNFGIQAGKASGAYTIAFTGNLMPGYKQTGADAYADTMDDVVALVERFIKK